MWLSCLFTIFNLSLYFIFLYFASQEPDLLLILNVIFKKWSIAIVPWTAFSLVFTPVFEPFSEECFLVC